jgi:acetylornithine deacetylase/succinyl-diaminopimelate desuccinylase-like protein
MQLEVVRLEGRTPLIFIEIPAATGGSDDDCVLLYGHLDKQPEMTGWDEGKGPWEPVLEGDRLYGRGGADDGYAIFGSLTALLALQAQGIAHARCVVLIEACEESGSYDLPAYVDHLAARIGKPSLVVCLDSGCGNYEQLWCTTSLRGMAGGNLTVKVLEEGVHSGDASGIVPSSFRIIRQLLSRIEDEATGRILVDGMHVEIPAERLEQAAKVASVLGTEVFDKFPFLPGMTLEIIAVEGRTPCLFFDVPATGTLGNDKTVLFYGHLDKQPEMTGWDEGKGPWEPVLEGDRLY